MQVRFTEYEDWFTKKRLLGACLAAYKKADRSSPTTCSGLHNANASGSVVNEVPHLIGVACLDMSLLASNESLRANEGWNDFQAAIDSARQACTRRTLSASALEQLRTAVGTNAICSSAATSALSTSPTYESRSSQVKDRHAHASYAPCPRPRAPGHQCTLCRCPLCLCQVEACAAGYPTGTAIGSGSGSGSGDGSETSAPLGMVVGAAAALVVAVTAIYKLGQARGRRAASTTRPPSAATNSMQSQQSAAAVASPIPIAIAQPMPAAYGQVVHAVPVPMGMPVQGSCV